MDNSASHRLNYISWDEYFIAMTILSQNQNFQPQQMNNSPPGSSAIILNARKIIIGISFNQTTSKQHAIIRAIEDAKRRLNPLENSTIYTLDVPCEECAEFLVKSGVKEVVYAQETPENHDNKEVEAILRNHNVFFRKFQTNREKIEFDFGVLM